MRNGHFSNLGQLLDGCQQGDRNCQRRLYELYFSYAMSICQRYAPHRNEAAEICNDAFFKTLTSLHRFDREQPFKPWFRRIVINAAVDFFRKKRLLPTVLNLSEMPEIADDPEPFPEISAETDLLPILAELSPAYRTVFNLYVMEEFSHREIGQTLGISESASRSNLARATSILKKLLIEKYGRGIQTVQK
jgi:RNA polymerase sigma-70 factor (ECF subfamily)